MDPISKKEGHCDITAHTVLLYVLFCLTYINVTFTGKVLRWKMYLQDKDFDLYHVSGTEEHQFVPDALSRLFHPSSKGR